MYIENIAAYYKASKRLDQIVKAEPNTEEAQELKSIMLALVQFVKREKANCGMVFNIYVSGNYLHQYLKACVLIY